MTRVWIERAACGLVLALALALAHGPIFRAGAGRVVPVPALPERNSSYLNSIYQIAVADVVFETWLGARNARTLISAPWRLHETEHCAPMERSITLSLPMFALGLLGVPAALWTHNPILVYNVELVLQSLVHALAMLTLVSHWTRSRAAGLVAALLFAFHPIRLGNITHPTVWDFSFTIFALFFAERLFRQGRWRDSVGLAAAIALQVAADFYPLVSATLAASPFALWLWLRRVPRRATPLQIALPVLVGGIAGAWLLGPYLQASRAGFLPRDVTFYFAPWKNYAPGAPLFLGWLLLALALLGALLPRRAALLPGVAGDPRPALVAGAALAALVAAGPDTGALLGSVLPFAAGFDPHALLARVVPGLASVRVVQRIAIGTLGVACVLGGVGSGWLLERVGRRAPALAAALVALALVACFGWPFAGQSRYRWQLEDVHPPDATIAFFRELTIQGNDGPLFEVDRPWASGERPLVVAPDAMPTAERILLSSWHGRRTSSCYRSTFQPSSRRLKLLANQVPARPALSRLRELGFTTLLLHHPPGEPSLLWLQSFEIAAAGPEPTLRLLNRNDELSAYEILADAAH